MYKILKIRVLRLNFFYIDIQIVKFVFVGIIWRFRSFGPWSAGVIRGQGVRHKQLDFFNRRNFWGWGAWRRDQNRCFFVCRFRLIQPSTKYINIEVFKDFLAVKISESLQRKCYLFATKKKMNFTKKLFVLTLIFYNQRILTFSINIPIFCCCGSVSLSSIFEPISNLRRGEVGFFSELPFFRRIRIGVLNVGFPKDSSSSFFKTMGFLFSIPNCPG